VHVAYGTVQVRQMLHRFQPYRRLGGDIKTPLNEIWQCVVSGLEETLGQKHARFVRLLLFPPKHEHVPVSYPKARRPNSSKQSTITSFYRIKPELRTGHERAVCTLLPQVYDIQLRSTGCAVICIKRYILACAKSTDACQSHSLAHMIDMPH
jgi:hypothetical protein